MFHARPGARVAALLLALAGGISLVACDERPKNGERGEKAPAGAQRPRADKAGPPHQVRPGARPETFADASVVGTWRIRVEPEAGAPEGVTYTFTADGRVTVGPAQICRYRIEQQDLAIDCAGTMAESARGRIERRDQNTLVWTAGDKTVRLERQPGVKEQQ